ncbi:hypothetical protein H6G41_29620 [Tolypothrix sp. FACHB-123]|uniref:hypothetical protein n=1 Tax=Tolypothrix sp. FACHB-123 TaxID=2692868 RepID=UPI001686EAE1|nr:hypothetical protein [Tolypothrix sp. FACHB-123]MBD2358706.1 hypothetical protein [Tolypothrix sp. FACHB-123]
MSDEPKHTTQTNEILQSSALIQRLDRRRTQPSGLINTSQSQRSSPRLPATMVQRFALLEQIQTRYGVSNNSSGTGTELMFISPLPKTTGEQVNTFTSEAASLSPKGSANTQPGTSTLSSTSNQAPTAKFRISRKAVPLEYESFPSKGASEPLSSSTQPSNEETFPSDSSMIPLKRISNNDTKTSAINSEIPSNSQDLLTAREIPLQVDASTSPKALGNSSLVMRKATNENLEEEIQRQPILRAKPLANNIQSPTQIFSSAPAEANSPLVLRKATNENLEEEIQRQPILRAKPLANNIQSPTQIFSSAPDEANSPLVLRKATNENLEEEIQRQPILRAKPLANNIQSPTQIFSSAPDEANSPLVLRKATNENLEEEIQRQPEQVAVSREIPGNMASLPQSTMVWRKSSQFATPGNNFSDASNGGTNNSFPLAITPVHHNAIARQTAPMSRTIPMSNPTMSMPRQAAMPVPEINVAEIAEQVSRLLCRQLTVERERRGMRK